MSNKFKIVGRPVTPQWRNELQLECEINFSMLERIKLLLGYKATVRAKVFCLNSPGRIETQWAIKVYDPTDVRSGLAQP